MFSLIKNIVDEKKKKKFFIIFIDYKNSILFYLFKCIPSFYEREHHSKWELLAVFAKNCIQ